MYKYCYSNEDAIYAKGLFYPLFYFSTKKLSSPVFLAGSSLSVSLNVQSSCTDQVIINITSSQPTEDLQQGVQTPPNKANLAEKTNSNSAESSTRSADDHGNLVRRRSFCKVPGLRRSVGTKRFSYPTANQVTKQDTGKRTSNDATTADVSRVVREKKSTTEEGKANIDHCATIDTSSPKGGEGELPITKRLKSDETRTPCESKRDVNTVNHIPKDDVLFDMDALSQFPVECICSPPSLNTLNGYIATSTAQQQVLSSESTEDLPQTSDTIAQEIDAAIVYKAKDTKTQSAVVHSDEQPFQNRNYQEDTKLQKVAPALRCGWKTGFHKGGKKIEISDKVLNCAHALLEELDLPTVSITSHKQRPTADELVDVDIFREGADLTKGAKTETAQPEMAQENHDGISTAFQATVGPVIERYSPEIEGNVIEVNEQRAAHKCIPKTDNISDIDKQHSSVVAGFCGFSTASGKQVHISESAMKQARKTLSEIDAELDVGDSGQTVKVTRGKESSCSISNKQRASGNGLIQADSEGPPHRNSHLKDVPQPDELTMDASGKNTSAIKEEIEEMALQNAGQSLNELKCKQSEIVNDSLLEDLLNDCKRQRRDSLATICEESEGMEEHHGRILTNTEEVSVLTRSRSDHERTSEYKENITTEYGSSTVPNSEKPRVLFKTASENPVSVSKAALSKAKNTWNKIDREWALEGACKPRLKNVESLETFHTVPAGYVDVSPRFLSIAKDSRRQTGEKMIKESNDVLNDDVLDTFEGQVSKIDHDFVSEDQNRSWTHSASSCGFETAIGETGERSEASFATFSGFQTAGGRKVTLSEDALRRGRDTMRQITTDPSEGLQENVDCHSANGKHHCGSKDVEVALRTGTQVMQKEDKLGSNTTNLMSFSGFQTAAGSCVTLSKEMLEKGAAVMQQIDKSLEQSTGSSIFHSPSTAGFSGFQTASGQSVKVSKESMIKGAAIMQQIDRSLQENSAEHTPSATSFSGFQTASGQSVTVSKESMEKGAAIMQQIDRSLQENSAEHTHIVTSFSGFQTASGQSVKVSKESMKKGAAIMQQIDRTLQENSAEHTRIVTSFSGFQTASGQSVKVSKESMKKGAAIMQQIDRSLQENSAEHTRSATSFSGFQTASGQSVTVSKESMEKGAAIMQQIDRSLQENSAEHTRSATSFSGFQTASGQSVKVSKESMKKGAAIMQQIDRSLQENSAEHTCSATSFSGFQTASGQSVKVSNESMKKGAAIMQQIDRSLQENSAEHTRSATSFSGFQTASGQSVKVSKESMIKGAAIMQQIDRSLQENSAEHTRNATSFSGFQTASGQGVKVSNESMKKGADIMQQIDRSLQETKHNSVSATGFPNTKPSSTRFSEFSGFQTAGGKKVDISESALAKAKETMADIDRELRATNTETVVINVDASKKAREELSIIEEENGNYGGTFGGFFTAGGQRVSVSEQALTKAKAFLQEADRSFNDSKTKDAEASVPERVVATEVRGQSTCTPGRSCFLEHDEAVSREVLESSEALLASESVMDTSDASGNLHDGIAVGCSSFNTSEGSFIAGREKGN